MKEESRPLRAMILAAGLGTRLKPWTDHQPKALVQINGRSLLQRNIEYLQQFGIYEIIVNVHHFASQIKEAIESNNGWGSKVAISNEPEVLETGGGLKKAAWFFEAGDFVLMNVDILTDMNLAEMIKCHRQYRCLATLAVRNRSTSRYFLFNPDNELCGWRNVKSGEQKIVKAASTLIEKAFSGIHIINSEIFPLITMEGKFSMVDLYLELAHTNIIRGFDHSSSLFVDVGKPESVNTAGSMFP